MNSQKFLLGGIVGGVVYFLLGWVVYGMLLKTFFTNNMWAAGSMRADADTIWWALVAGQLAGGFLLAYIIGKANAASVGAGAGVGFIVGLLVCLSFDLTMYGVSTTVTSLKGLAADVAVSAVISAIAGATVGGILGSGKRTVAVA
jgi:hypothetical protein